MSYAELVTVDQQSEELSERFSVQSYIQNLCFNQDEVVSLGEFLATTPKPALALNELRHQYQSPLRERTQSKKRQKGPNIRKIEYVPCVFERNKTKSQRRKTILKKVCKILKYLFYSFF